MFCVESPPEDPPDAGALWGAAAVEGPAPAPETPDVCCCCWVDGGLAAGLAVAGVPVCATAP
ncbi:MAG: hypothetical protein ACRYG8_06405 [Janthinobacterium lividum]